MLEWIVDTVEPEAKQEGLFQVLCRSGSWGAGLEGGQPAAQTAGSACLPSEEAFSRINVF